MDYSWARVSMNILYVWATNTQLEDSCLVVNYYLYVLLSVCRSWVWSVSLRPSWQVSVTREGRSSFTLACLLLRSLSLRSGWVAPSACSGSRGGAFHCLFGELFFFTNSTSHNYSVLNDFHVHIAGFRAMRVSSSRCVWWWLRITALLCLELITPSCVHVLAKTWSPASPRDSWPLYGNERLSHIQSV